MSHTISINPATGKQEATYEHISLENSLQKIALAKEAFNKWKKTSFKQRAELMHKLAKVLEKNKEMYARLATCEMGKVINQSRKEIEKCALICRFYADNADRFLANETVETEASKSYITFMPMGVILAIMPWNFPFYQLIRFAAPALMAENTAVLKHASNVQGVAFALEEAFEKAGFPKEVFINLNITTKDVKPIIEDPNIVAVTLTGSEIAGRSVASIVGQNLKKTVMELGGSDAYIILDDINLEQATDLATFGRLQNTGQTCIAAKRFIILKNIYEKFLLRFTEKAAKMGYPMDETSYYGSMARIDLRDELHEQVKKRLNKEED